MQRNRHSTAFREQALAKARDRGNRTLEAVAREINISLSTLKGPPVWSARDGARPAPEAEPASGHGNGPAHRCRPQRCGGR